MQQEVVGVGYSVWLMPKGEVYRNLDKIIRDLSKRYGTPYFEPHVTLTGGLKGPEDEIIHRTHLLADFLEPYKITLTKVGYTDNYFRCMFIRAKETKPVMAANAIAKGIYDVQKDEPYMPHSSLAYGNLDMKTKKQIIASLPRRFNLSFEVKSIHLYSTRGRVEEWCKIKEFPLR